MRTRRVLVGLAALAAVPFLAVGCGHGERTSLPQATHAADASFVVSSADFTDHDALPASANGNGNGGRCTGENISPQLSWTGAPEGTVAYAITVVDITGGNYVHWTKADIPATVADIPAGGADALAGVGGQTEINNGSYFGPCPDVGDRSYKFTVYALDSMLNLKRGFLLADLYAATSGHIVAQANIVGVASPTP